MDGLSQNLAEIFFSGWFFANSSETSEPCIMSTGLEHANAVMNPTSVMNLTMLDIAKVDFLTLGQTFGRFIMWQILRAKCGWRGLPAMQQEIAFLLTLLVSCFRLTIFEFTSFLKKLKQTLTFLISSSQQEFRTGIYSMWLFVNANEGELEWLDGLSSAFLYCSIILAEKFSVITRSNVKLWFLGYRLWRFPSWIATVYTQRDFC